MPVYTLSIHCIYSGLTHQLCYNGLHSALCEQIKAVCWVRPNPPSTQDSFKLPQRKRQVSCKPLACGLPEARLLSWSAPWWGKLWPKPWSGRELRLAFLTSFIRTVLLEVKCHSFVIWLSALQRLGNSRPIKGIKVSRARHIYRFVLIITCCIHASHCNSVPLKDAQILCHME